MTIANPYLHGDKTHERLKRRASVAGLALAVVLALAKFAAFLTTGSVSLLSSLMDSLFDATASIVTLVSISLAAIPADRDHRFGHGKIEALGALAQAMFISASAIFLFIESIHRFIEPQDVKAPAVGIGVMILSIALTAALIAFQRHVIRKTGSVAITADHLHYKGDLLMNFSVFAAILLGYYTRWPYFDPLFAVLIAIRLMYGTAQVGKEAFDILLDKEIPDLERRRIIDLVSRHTEVRGVHDLRTRRTGERTFMEFHIELDRDMPFRRVHDVMDEIETALFAVFPKSEVLIHPEPAGLQDHRLDNVLT